MRQFFIVALVTAVFAGTAVWAQQSGQKRLILAQRSACATGQIDLSNSCNGNFVPLILQGM